MTLGKTTACLGYKQEQRCGRLAILTCCLCLFLFTNTQYDTSPRFKHPKLPIHDLDSAACRQMNQITKHSTATKRQPTKLHNFACSSHVGGMRDLGTPIEGAAVPYQKMPRSTTSREQKDYGTKVNQLTLSCVRRVHVDVLALGTVQLDRFYVRLVPHS